MKEFGESRFYLVRGAEHLFEKAVACICKWLKKSIEYFVILYMFLLLFLA
jgi:hypothetical protein